MSHRPGRLVVVLALLATALVPALPAPDAAAAPPPAFVPPVDAPVHDPFRVPDGPYAAGNRGIEYDTAPGTPVVAPADGRVAFAGWVAGTRHVTVLHRDGVRTTASYLAEVAVVVGQEVRQGDLLGTTSGRLHFGARRGDAYFDPATLFSAEPVVVRLVPFDHPPGVGLGGERSAVSQLIGGLGRAVGGVVDAAGATGAALGSAAAWTWDQAEPTVRLIWHYAPHLAPPWVKAGLLVAAGIHSVWTAWELSHRECTEDDEPVAPPMERRIGVLVAGFGSSSGHTSIDDLDVEGLGYEPADVLRFSYAGGRVPDDDVGLPIDAAPYGATEANQDLRTSGARLADVVEDVVAAAPGVPVDLLAHSQGGVVARLALIELERRHGTGWLDAVGLLATIGTPHGGADLATAGVALGYTKTGRRMLDAVDALGLVGATDPSMAQLAESSDVIAELGAAGLPPGLDAVSVGARGDLTVAAPHTELEGATEATVPLVGPSAHGELPGDPRTAREVALALAGAPPRCVELATALADEVVGRGVAAVEDAAGLLLVEAAGAVDRAAARRGGPAALAGAGTRR